jgi:hypothetical protein
MIEKIEQLIGEAMTYTGCELTCEKAERKAIDARDNASIQILSFIASEIEKVRKENPYNKQADETTTKLDVQEYIAFDNACQKILSLLKEDASNRENDRV